MPGHGRPILGLEDVGGRSGRMVLPLALTSRLQTNTLRQVFTSLRPLVVHTRQRTLSTYARRLHERHVNSQPRQHQETIQESLVRGERSESDPHLRNHPGLHRSRVQDQQNASNVVIDIEENNSNPEQFTSHTIEGHSAGISSSISSSHSPHSPHSNSSHDSTEAEPLITQATNSTTAENGNGVSEIVNEDDPTTNRNGNESVSELLNQFPEIRNFLVAAWQYLIFVFIILSKLIFDHFSGLLVVLGLGVGFMWANGVVKSAAGQHARRPAKPLLALLVNIPAALFLLYYIYRGDKLFYTLLLLPPEHESVGVGELVWLILVSDYVLKLATVFIKAFITLFPHSLLHYQNRGKYFLVVEMGSQLYRSLAPVQPWLYYLLEGYAGPKKVLGVLLSAAYMVCKGPDVVAKMKCFQGSFVKFLNSVSYGHTPTKAQLDSSGCLCPICHDDYQQPTMLRCKHIFCEACVVQWFDRERTCPLCRSQVADDPAWRDGSTTHHIQLF